MLLKLVDQRTLKLRPSKNPLADFCTVKNSKLLINYLKSDNEDERVEQIFEREDKDKNGYISRKEISRSKNTGCTDPAGNKIACTAFGCDGYGDHEEL